VAKCERCGKAGASEVKREHIDVGRADPENFPLDGGLYTTTKMLCGDCEKKLVDREALVRRALIVALFLLFVLIVSHFLGLI
jgi:hypothetical protein